jgi:hypothetical protein
MESDDLSSKTVLAPKKRGRGRPKKAEVALYKKPKGTVGRPVGDNQRMKDLKARLLATAGDGILDKVLQIARNDDHPSQMAALKLCWDRMLPQSLFEKDVKGGRSSVTINIVGVDGMSIDQGPVDEVIEMEEVENEA